MPEQTSALPAIDPQLQASLTARADAVMIALASHDHHTLRELLAPEYRNERIAVLRRALLGPYADTIVLVRWNVLAMTVRIDRPDHAAVRFPLTYRRSANQRDAAIDYTLHFIFSTAQQQWELALP